MINNPEPTIVPGAIIRTSGAPQIAVTTCPGCGDAHRHMSTGLRRGACGCTYIVRLADQAAASLRAA